MTLSYENTNRLKAVGITGGVVGIFALTLFILAREHPDPAQPRPAMQPSLEARAEGAPTPAPLPVPSTSAPVRRLPIKTTAAALHGAFLENAVRAGRTFDRQLVDVSGSVQRVEQHHATGVPLLMLSSGSQYEPVHVLLSTTQGAHDAAAELRRGEEVQVECYRFARLGGVVVARECILFESRAVRAQRAKTSKAL